MLRTIALVFGAVYALVGLLGFVPGVTDANGLLLGIFAVDPLHNIVHLLLGVGGLAAAFGGFSRLYAQVAGVILLLLGVLGALLVGMGDGTMLGLVHVNGADHILHLVSGAVLAYFGFLYREPGMASTDAR